MMQNRVELRDTNSNIIKIAVIDPSTLLREGLSRLLDNREFRIVLSCSDIDSAIRYVERNMNVNLFLLNLRRQPDAALIDLQRMRAASVHSRIVAMSTELSVPLLAESLKAGADGFLLKDVSADALSLFLKLVIIGEKVFPTSLADYITNIDVADQHASIGMGEHNLSKREVQILKRLVRGESNKVIARSLDITEGTVKVHIKNLFRKIQAHNRTQAALWAREQGIFSLGADGT